MWCSNRAEWSPGDAGTGAGLWAQPEMRSESSATTAAAPILSRDLDDMAISCFFAQFWLQPQAHPAHDRPNDVAGTRCLTVESRDVPGMSCLWIVIHPGEGACPCTSVRHTPFQIKRKG